MNPSSLKAEDQEAINYNLRLSFARANSIFKHLFDTQKISFDHQRTLLPMVKVVGRGFLPKGATARDLPDSMPEKELCAKCDCRKSQKVIVKFNLKD